MESAHTPKNVSFRYMKLPFYFTPRAALMKYLRDDQYSNIVRWIDITQLLRPDLPSSFEAAIKNGQTIEFCDYDEFVKLWGSEIGMTCVNHADNFVTSDLWGSMEAIKFYQSRSFWPDTPLDVFVLAMKSTDDRDFLHDLRPGPLTEWIIKFLLEETRIDWVKWENRDELEFKILNSSEIRLQYLDVNGIRSKNPEFVLRMILTSYCTTKILIEIDRRNYHYKFNKKWYAEEITKLGSDTEYFQSIFERCQETRRNFPFAKNVLCIEENRPNFEAHSIWLMRDQKKQNTEDKS